MVTTLYELYKRNPGHFFLRCGGGMGKTTQLKYFRDLIVREKLPWNGRECTVIPIYISMGELNRRLADIDALFLYRYLQERFRYGTTIEAVKDLLKREAYLFVFLLDGINELTNVRRGGEDVYSFLAANMEEMIREFTQVHFIVTSRVNFPLFTAGLEESFQKISMNRLPNAQIREYLGFSKTEQVDPSLEALVNIPMFVRMYRTIREVRPDYRLQDRNHLMNDFFEVDRVRGRISQRLQDRMTELRTTMLDYVFPYLACRLELSQMKREERPPFDDLAAALEACRREKLLQTEDLEGIEELIRGTSVFRPDKMAFSHSIVQDYFAAKAIWILRNREDYNTEFLQTLTAWLEYRGSKDLDRRTRYLDLAEFVFAFSEEPNRESLTERLYGREGSRLYQKQEFYEELSGVYDDLKNRKQSSEIAWMAYDILEDLLENYPEQPLSRPELAIKYNFLFYCIINYADGKSGDRQPIHLLDRVESLLLEEEVKSVMSLPQYNDLFCKVYANRGAYYTSKWVSPPDYEEALRWHREALELRRNLGLNLQESFRMIMSDCFYLNRYSEAFDAYQNALRCYAKKRKLSMDQVYEREEPGLLDLIERGLGVTMELLGEKKCPEEAFLADTMLHQMAFVFRELMKEQGRRDTDTWNSFQKKLEKLSRTEADHKWTEAVRCSAAEYYRRMAEEGEKRK